MVEVSRLTEGQGVDVILDMVGGPYIERNLKSLAVEGRLVQIAFLQASKVEVDWMRLKITAPEPQLVELGDPFAAVDTRVDELINHMHKGHNSGEK